VWSWLRLEAAKDDYRIRCEELVKELVEARSQNEELTSLADEAQSLKDEMDVLRWGTPRHASFCVCCSRSEQELSLKSVFCCHMYCTS